MLNEKNLLLRIEGSYLKSKKIFNQTEKSIHWKKILEKKNFSNLSKLSNFRNNDLGQGHDDSLYYNKEKFTKEIRILTEKLNSSYILKNIKKKNIGNLNFFFDYFGTRIDPGDLHLIKYLFDLEKYVFNSSKIQYVCEIGGGYGGLAEKIIKNYNCKYILIDLPETNCISSYYLIKNFPKKKFCLFEDLKKQELDLNTLKKYDIFIIPPFIQFKDLKIDLFINTRSMMEMRFSTICKYFELIHNNISNNGYFFNANRYIKFRAGEPIFFKDYPYDKFWKVLSSSKSFQQDWIHQLITKRDLAIVKNEIHVELNEIKKETKKYLQPSELRYLEDRNIYKKNSFFKKKIYLFLKVLLGKGYIKYREKFYYYFNKFI